MKRYLISYELETTPYRGGGFKKNKMRIVNAANQGSAWEKLHNFYRDKSDDTFDDNNYYQITEIFFMTEEIL